MSQSVVDEEVPYNSGSRGGGMAARPAVSETVSASGGTATEDAGNGVEHEKVGESTINGRTYKESTLALLDKLDQPDTDDEMDPDDVGLIDPDEGKTAEVAGAPPSTDHVDVVNEWQTKATKFEEANQRLVAELETVRKLPRAVRTERETALLAAEQAYVDENPVAAVRLFLATVLGTKADSADVDAELSGLYTDLTARELNVPLEASHQALRDGARTRLALARDKRERTAATTPTTEASHSDDAKVIENAAPIIESELSTKRENGKSFADDHPKLMVLAEHIDGVKPQVLIARIIQRDIRTGALDPKLSNDALVKATAAKVEKYYSELAAKIAGLITPPPIATDTTKSGPATAAKTSPEQRPNPGARTITNATASVAPATSPKTKTLKAPATEKKQRKDFPTDKAWKEHLLTTHFPT